MDPTSLTDAGAEVHEVPELEPIKNSPLRGRRARAKASVTQSPDPDPDDFVTDELADALAALEETESDVDAG